MRRPGTGVRAVIGVVLVAGVLAGCWARTPDAHAAVASRGDPKIWVSGMSAGGAISCKITIDVAISTSSNAIQSVAYALNGPVGTAVRHEVATGGVLKNKESYTYAADRADQQVATVTMVTTTGSSVPVTLNESGSGSPAIQISGMSNQPILSLISCAGRTPSASWGS